MHTSSQKLLSERLQRLSQEAKAGNAFVFDAWGLVWCSAWWPTGEEQDVLFPQVKSVLEGLTPPLEKGGSVNGVYAEFDHPIFCRSFASTYVLGVWVLAETAPFALRRAVADAVPDVERLTLGLPPYPGGTGGTPSSGIAFSRP